MKTKVAGHVAWQVVGGEGIVVDLRSGATIGLNPVATFVLRHVSESPERIAELVAGEFDVSAETAGADVAEFLNVLEARGLIVREKS